MADMAIPKREDVEEKYTWDLRDMFESDETWKSEYESLKSIPEEYEKYRGRLGESAETLLEYLRFGDEVSLRLEKLFGYANCKSDQDTSNAFYQDMRGKAMNILVSVSSASAFATPELIAIDDERLDGFFAERPELETYRRVLYFVRRRKAHVLSAAEERLLSAMGEMAEAPDNICSIFRNADLTFPDAIDGDGKAHQLTDAGFVPLLESADRVLRRSAFETYYKQLGQFKNTVAATLDAQFKQLRFFAEARKYGSTLEAALDENEVPIEVYTNLIETVHANMDKM